MSSRSINSIRKETINKIKQSSIFSEQSEEIEEGIYNRAYNYSVDTSLPLEDLYANTAETIIAILIKNPDTIMNLIKTKKLKPKNIADEDLEKLDENTKDRKIQQDNLQALKDDNNGSDLYECPRCRKKNVKITQKQLRRSDEPPSILVRCLECGHSWRIE
jgi:DNA-directed RNA polymerase subunit M/transcription elongation factor TFIIS